jgi:tetratricopeptide (TPR) repeat protein
LKPTPPKNTLYARNPQNLQVVFVCLLLVLAVWTVFGRTARFGFVNYDDQADVYDNPVVASGLTLQGTLWAFSFHSINWFPLTWLSHMLDCQLYGLLPGGHHLTNVVLHTVSVILLFLVLRQMTDALWRSAFVAAVFAIHPLRVESVAWVAERKDVLSGVFFMLTMAAYVRYARNPWSPGRYGAVMLLFALGLMSKPMLVTLPLVLLLLDYWPLRRAESPARLVIEKLPLLVLSAADCVATLLAQHQAIRSAGAYSLPYRLENALVSSMIYLGQMVFPARLAVHYPYPREGQPFREVVLAALLLAGLSVLAWAARRTRPWLLVGWVWYLVMVLPVLGIIQAGEQSHADRYTYLPCIGLVIAATWAVSDLSAGWRHRQVALGCLMTAALSTLIACSFFQTAHWKDSESLWNHALACTSNNPLAHFNLGNAFLKQGKLDDAVAQYQKALEIQPGLASVHYNLGNAFLDLGKLDDAIAQYRKTLEIRPNNADSYYNLGRALFMQGKLDDAIADYRKAVEIEPDSVEALIRLGNALAAKGARDAAITQYQKALTIRPDDAEARTNLGKALLLKGDLDGAMSCFAESSTLNQDPLARWYGLGNVFLQNGDLDEAIICYRQALKINPHSDDAFANLGVAFLKKKETNAAMDSWQQALTINPSQMSAQNNLAWLLATTPDNSLRNGTKAVALATQANQLNGGGNPVILHTLAAAYAEDGKFELACGTARRALELALAQKQDALARKLKKELKLYESNTPLRNAPQ